MALPRKRRYCIFRCDALGAYLHRYPHPDRRSDLFKKWVSIVGEKLKETDPWKIYKNKRICSYHFTAAQKVSSHRLRISAVPSINLDGVFKSPVISIMLEHNYCISASTSTSVLDNSSNRGPDVSYSAIITDKDLLARIEPNNQPSTSQCTDFRGMFKCDRHRESLQNYFIDSTKNVIVFRWCSTINQILSGKSINNDMDDPIKKKAQLYHKTYKLKK